MPLSPLPRVSSRSRGVRTRGSRRDRRQPDRVNGAGCSDDPGHLPSDELPRPATPSRAPGSGVPRLRGLAAAVSGCRHLFTSLWILADTTDGQAPVHVPRCQRESRFSGPRRRLPTSATCFATRGHTLRAIDPRTRVELSLRCSPAPTDAGCVGLRDALPHRGPASHDLHATACARCVPLAWTRQNVGRSARVKASRALLDDVRVPSS
jgi:hypothetical protein